MKLEKIDKENKNMRKIIIKIERIILTHLDDLIVIKIIFL